MAVAVTEKPQFDVSHEPDDVRFAAELDHDYRIRSQAQRFIGSCLLRETADITFAEEVEHTRAIESLHDAIQLAAEGDERAQEMIKTNVVTDIIERTYKAGHITSVTLNRDEAGRIQQFGQSMESVQANSLRYASCSPQMLERTKAETTTSFLIADYHRRGLLEEYNVVVLSRAADDMDETAMADNGFFVDTMSTSIQVTSATGEILTTESAFVAGKRSRHEPRHDAETIAGLGYRLGLDLAHKSATELLATPLLVHKSVMPNGVVDLVRLYDDAAGGTFFGQAQPQQNYFNYLTQCKQREARFAPLVTTITNKLMAEAATITNRLQAVQRLHQLSQDHMVIQAAFDDSIDPRVFGPAAADIERARFYIQAENYDAAQLAIRDGQKTAVSSSCPTAFGVTNGAEDQNSSTSDTPDDCEFVSKECPKCHKKNVLTKVSKGKISGRCGCSAKLT